MKISYNWLKEFVDLKKYPVAKLADLLTMNFAEVDGIEEVDGDSILDLKILPDRASDCLSHRGVAREISAFAVSSFKFQVPKFKFKENKKIKTQDLIEVVNKEPALCRRYVSRVILNVKVGPSPKWLSQRLGSLGQKSINNVVDATNYVMLELGQPLHIFDLNKIENMQAKSEKLKVKSEKPKIVIRKAKKGEKITTLDNREVELSDDILVIASEAKQSVSGPEILAIAGVKGGKKAEVDATTKNIILESANFSAESVRKASRLTGIKTDSSIRFVADLDPNLAGEAMERLASLMVGVAGGEVAGGEIDVYPRPVKEYKVGFSLEDVNDLLGIELPEKEVLDILKQLNFKTQKVAPRKEILSLAKKLKGKPYKYGASVSFDAPDAFDCSSFVSYVFAQSGIQMPRMTVDQYFYSEAVDEKSAKPGDLVFANTKEGKIFYESQEFLKGTKIKEGIDHIGLYVGNGKVIHATRKTGKVAIEDIKKSKSFKNLRGFRRLKDIEKKNIFVVNIPTYRRDIGPKGTFVLQKADIIEEIGRIYGYQNIPSKLPTGILTPPKIDNELYFEFVAKNAMLAAGFSEASSYSFIGSGDLQNIGLDPQSVLELQNYPSDERRYLRPSLIFGFLRNIKDNFRNFDEVRIFEVGRVFGPSVDSALERKFFGGAISYKKSLNKDMAKEFYEVKATVDLLMGKLAISGVWYDDHETELVSFEKNIYHPLRSAEIKIGDKGVGFIGEINSKISDAYEIENRVAVFEIDFNGLARFANENYVFKPISRYPAVIRDLAVLVSIQTKTDAVLNTIKNIGGELLVDADIFDIYEGDKILAGTKSIACHLMFQSQNRTLSDKEIDESVKKIVAALEQKGWSIRG